MPIVILAAGTVLLGGLGAYAIHSFSPGINAAEQTTANGISQATTVIGIAVALTVIYYGYTQFKKQ